MSSSRVTRSSWSCEECRIAKKKCLPEKRDFDKQKQRCERCKRTKKPCGASTSIRRGAKSTLTRSETSLVCGGISNINMNPYIVRDNTQEDIDDEEQLSDYAANGDPGTSRSQRKIVQRQAWELIKRLQDTCAAYKYVSDIYLELSYLSRSGEYDSTRFFWSDKLKDMMAKLEEDFTMTYTQAGTVLDKHMVHRSSVAHALDDVERNFQRLGMATSADHLSHTSPNQQARGLTLVKSLLTGYSLDQRTRGGTVAAAYVLMKLASMPEFELPELESPVQTVRQLFNRASDDLESCLRSVVDAPILTIGGTASTSLYFPSLYLALSLRSASTLLVYLENHDISEIYKAGYTDGFGRTLLQMSALCTSQKQTSIILRHVPATIQDVRSSCYNMSASQIAAVHANQAALDRLMHHRGGQHCGIRGRGLSVSGIDSHARDSGVYSEQHVPQVISDSPFVGSYAAPQAGLDLPPGHSYNYNCDDYFDCNTTPVVDTAGTINVAYDHEALEATSEQTVAFLGRPFNSWFVEQFIADNADMLPSLGPELCTWSDRFAQNTHAETICSRRTFVDARGHHEEITSRTVSPSRLEDGMFTSTLLYQETTRTTVSDPEAPDFSQLHHDPNYAKEFSCAPEVL